ncbi:CBS and ACT domain-containing protein [Deinococcus roseus]|uniref:Acetoin dehydrogenase n=1 Tax=Deinococcus roseus TaxID=392414 RepID=A0ABQ2D3J7_9DEIO|nr:CBS and ACT domain-containing protein [Deinococcus roseus]GGJ41316.1 acetoin dehydrogenase [Deinococcus roseus]
MLVRDIMTRNPISVQPETSIHDAFLLMQNHQIRHLPIMQDGDLLGMVSNRDIRWVVSAFVTPQVEVLQTQSVEQLMVQPVLTVDEEQPIEEAARIMRSHKVGSLMVLNDHDQVVGIVTGIDLLDAIINLTGVHQPSSRLEVELKSEPGELARVSQLMADLGINIVSVLTSQTDDHHQRFVFRIQTINARVAAHKLRAAGFQVVYPQ